MDKLVKRLADKGIPKKKTVKINKLEKDLQFKPRLRLTPLEKTGIHVPTYEQYTTLMRVYECGGWKWIDGDLPTSCDCWSMNGKETYVDAGISYKSDKKRKFGFCNGILYRIYNWKVISTEEFYEKQNVTEDRIDRVMEYFEKLS